MLEAKVIYYWIIVQTSKRTWQLACAHSQTSNTWELQPDKFHSWESARYAHMQKTRRDNPSDIEV